tara:strand:- start:1169 stop:1885 length:717 start_codon:yes stop_codon:yes gene_type:complete
MLSLIIPCFNEEKNLTVLLKNIESLLKKYSEENIEVLIVDNGSTDGTRDLLNKHDLVINNKISIIKIEKNDGYGNGIYKGIISSSGNYISWFHADLQIDPHDVVEIFLKSKQKLLNEECIIKGLRINRNFFDIIFTFGMTIITLLFFRIRLNDINAQPKIFKKNFIKYLSNPPKDFSFDLYFLLKAKKEKLKIYEFPVNWSKRYAGEAKGGGTIKLKIKLTFRTLKFMFKLIKDSKWN